MAGPDKQARRPAALLLTGGGSRRMGRDKATLVIAGDRLADRTAALLRPVAHPVIEVGPGYTSLSRTRENPPGSGPLAALAAGAGALRALHHGGPVLVVATDLPRLTAAYLQLLVDHRVPHPDHCVVPRDAGGRAQPLCARYSLAALACAEDLFATGERAMKALLQRVAVTWLDPDPSDVLFDIDTPEDLGPIDRAKLR
ncbi:MAG: molybdenum cofactor guanylyltransferase [Actinomycetota bacterium]|nr:molybdenum cofactor guanylyltransferase [Actinomycetota bacterium]